MSSEERKMVWDIFIGIPEKATLDELEDAVKRGREAEKDGVWKNLGLDIRVSDSRGAVYTSLAMEGQRLETDKEFNERMKAKREYKEDRRLQYEKLKKEFEP